MCTIVRRYIFMIKYLQYWVIHLTLINNHAVSLKVYNVVSNIFFLHDLMSLVFIMTENN